MKKCIWLIMLVILGGCATQGQITALQNELAAIKTSKAKSTMLLAQEAGAKRFWWRDALTGATGLDQIDIGSLSDGDAAFVMTESGTTMTIYPYVFNAADTTATNSPINIRLTGGTGVWWLATVQGVGFAVSAADGYHYIDVSNTSALTDKASGRCSFNVNTQKFECIASNGTTVLTIGP